MDSYLGAALRITTPNIFVKHMKHLLLGLVALSFSLPSFAQQFRCGTDQMRLERIAEDPTYLLREAQQNEEIRQLIANSIQRGDGDRDIIATIPIVFHVIHLGGGENITNEQILNQVELLNEDFQALNDDLSEVYPAFTDIIGNTQIRFALPTLDPEGNCTNGIDRIFTPETNVGDDGSKMNAWPRQKYLNVWVVNNMRAGTAGYAYYPSAFTGIIEQLADGIILRHNYVGEIGTSNYNNSTALSHEVGHYLNLQHVWGNNNGEAGVGLHMIANCGDDDVEDTPITKGWNQCPPDPRDWADCDTLAFDSTRIEGVIYRFDEVTTTSGTTDPITPYQITAPTGRIRANFAPPTATGVSANSAVDGRFAFTGWDGGAVDGETDFANLTGSFNGAKYYSFTVEPTVSDVATITSLSFNVDRNATGIRTFAVSTSATNFVAPIAITAAGQPNISIQPGNVAFYTADASGNQLINVALSGSGFSKLLTPVTFRIYGWNAEDASGTFEIDDLRINGRSVRIENVQNIMEYSYCSNMFTMGQSSRMIAAASSSTGDRNMTWTEENLRAVGIAEGFEAQCAPIADFYPRVFFNAQGAVFSNEPYTPMVCTGVNVQYVDNSKGGFPNAWSWSFQDGSPATSTDRNPVVNFTSPGWKSVTLTVSNDNGSNTNTNEWSILIGGEPNDVYGLYQEGFEDDNGLAPFVHYNYADNITKWSRTTTASYSGNACAVLNSGQRNFLDLIDAGNERDYDDLVSPTYDLSRMVNADLSFRYAYNTTINELPSVTERLEVMSSTDCGKTWVLRANLTGAELINNGLNSQVPPPAWAFKSINLPTSVRTHDVRFRFRYISSAFSGNLYLDDINISGIVGIEGLDKESFMSLYPNPTNDRFNLAVYGMDRFSTIITVQDMRGAVVYSTVRKASGGAGMEFSGSELGLADGMYLIRASNEAGSSAQKLLVGK